MQLPSRLYHRSKGELKKLDIGELVFVVSDNINRLVVIYEDCVHTAWAADFRRIESESDIKTVKQIIEDKRMLNPQVVEMARNFYARRLIELNPILLVTPAMLVHLNRQAEGLRQGMKKTETNPVWDVPVSIEADGTSPTRFEVILSTL